jgi:hypothetical protein
LVAAATTAAGAGAPGSHAKQGWEQLTDQIVRLLAVRQQPVVFMLWGAQAQAKKSLIDLSPTAANHLLLMANHPSPLSALRGPLPFIGCGHFGKYSECVLEYVASEDATDVLFVELYAAIVHDEFQGVKPMDFGSTALMRNTFARLADPLVVDTAGE